MVLIVLSAGAKKMIIKEVIRESVAIECLRILDDVIVMLKSLI
jgi:hypothetical protein